MPRFKVKMLKAAQEFYLSQPRQAQKKIAYVMDRVAGGEMNKDLFKKLKGYDLWEFRIEYNSIQYRFLAFWDTKNETLVVVTHGFVKKSWEIPQAEINLGLSVQKKYAEQNK